MSETPEQGKKDDFGDRWRSRSIKTPQGEKWPWLGVALIVWMVVGLLVVAFIVVNSEPAAQPPAATVTQDPTQDPETVAEFVVPSVCEDVILMNEMLVSVGQTVYSEAIDALIEDDVKGIKNATESLRDYRDLVAEVSEGYEQDREDCLGFESNAEEAIKEASEIGTQSPTP